jgi:hypothetical protein
MDQGQEQNPLSPRLSISDDFVCRYTITSRDRSRGKRSEVISHTVVSDITRLHDVQQTLNLGDAPSFLDGDAMDELMQMLDSGPMSGLFPIGSNSHREGFSPN